MPKSRKQAASSKKLIPKSKAKKTHLSGKRRSRASRTTNIVIPAKAGIYLKNLSNRFRVPSRVNKPGMTRNFLGVTVLIIGIVLLIFPLAFKTLSHLKISKPNLQKVSAENIKAKNNQDHGPIKIDSQLLSGKEVIEPPERIVVPNLNIDLPIVEAKVVDGYWELSETSASHGVGSANPGEIGNQVIFAHARDELFGPLRKAKKESIIYVLTKDHWYNYQVSDIKLVDPTDVQTIAPTPDQTLTLYTCDGFLDSKRLIITAKSQN